MGWTPDRGNSRHFSLLFTLGQFCFYSLQSQNNPMFVLFTYLKPISSYSTMTSFEQIHQHIVNFSNFCSNFSSALNLKPSINYKTRLTIRRISNVNNKAYISLYFCLKHIKTQCHDHCSNIHQLVW